MEWVETVYDPDRIAAGSTRNSRAP
jgi:hypothetical protein